VGGELVGGCSETFEAYSSGALRERLKRAGVSLGAWTSFDADELLPEWLHPT
jgi:hypothetical protein